MHIQMRYRTARSEFSRWKAPVKFAYCSYEVAVGRGNPESRRVAHPDKKGQRGQLGSQFEPPMAWDI